ncbi:VTT domain-containing protein [Patescibacteria group bacterium]|nr:VTT domain-containing protein [Patescibacteria group bacterium]
MVQKILKIIQSTAFKKTIVVLGSFLAVASILISINPEPFLKTGYLGVFMYGMLGPVTLIIPVMSQHLNLVLLSAVAAAGVVVNDTLAYIVGRNADAFIQKSKKVLLIEKWVNKYGVFALFFISISPLPYDFVGLIVGYLDLSFRKYVIPLFLGKFIRFVLVGLGTSFILGW